MAKAFAFISQFLQEQWAYDYAYVHLVPDLVVWLLEKLAVAQTLPSDALAVTFRVPLDWQPVLVEDCEHVNLTDSFMAGNDFLITSDQEFPLTEGTLPSWAQISVTKTHVSWQISAGDDWLETHALSLAVLEKIAGATDEERGMVMLAPEVMAAMQQLGEMGHA
jgi:hypothetical protein